MGTSGFALQFLLLPIRDWNESQGEIADSRYKLQFLLLPIRDWNLAYSGTFQSIQNCNFSYSLLGIETEKFANNFNNYYCDCNFSYSLLGIETK